VLGSGVAAYSEPSVRRRGRLSGHRHHRHRLANVLRRLDTRDWELRIVYNWPQRTERTLRWVAANALHDVRHHLLDIRRRLA
jgi:hypothetical protein